MPEREKKRWQRRKRKKRSITRRGTGTERPHRGPQWRSLVWGGNSTPLEENADLPGFHPESAHLLLQGVYGYFPHHNDRSHLDGGITDGAAWQRRWRRIAAQSASWYATPFGAVGHRFMAILVAK